MKIQRPARLAIAVVVALGAIPAMIVTLGTITVLSFIQKRTSRPPPSHIDAPIVRDVVDRAKEDEWLVKEKEWLAKEKERLERRKEQLERLLAQTQINSILLMCNGTTKYDNEEKPVKGKEI